MLRQITHIIRVRAVAAGVPAKFQSRLPQNVRRVIGVKGWYCIGLEGAGQPAITDGQRIGWFHLELNSKRSPIGQFDVFPSLRSSHEYQDVSEAAERGAIISGMYYQETLMQGYTTDVNPNILVPPAAMSAGGGSNPPVSQAVATHTFPGAFVTIFLKCETDD